MKLLTLILSATCLMGMSPFESPNHELKIVNVCNVTDQESREIIEGQHPEMAIEFAAGTTLPFNLFLKGDIVSLSEFKGTLPNLEVKQTFYVRNVEKQVFFSTNLREWKPLRQFVTANIFFNLKAEEGHPTLEAWGDLDVRQ